jgi:NADH:ubiquinone oxidoreductase subunit C
VDTGERFEVVYNIASTGKKLRLDFKTALDRENPSVESITPVWPAAYWYEREMYELYGFEVNNHDDMRPLLLPEDWDQGFPMRKDWDAPDFVRMPEL